MKNSNYIVLDTETGGLSATDNPITEIALISLKAGSLKEMNRFETFVKPYNDLIITDEALKKSRVSMKQIEQGMEYKKLYKFLIEFFNQTTTVKSRGNRDRPICVGHNVAFDMDFLEVLFYLNNDDLYKYVHKQTICTFSEGKQMWENSFKSNDENGLKLADCCKRAGIKLVDAHGAMNDTVATSKLFKFFYSIKSSDTNKTTVVQTEKEQKTRNFFQF